MSKAGGYISIFVGLVFLLGAYGAYSESSELQSKHDTYCGGIMEALLDWDGNCEELREYISMLEIGSIILLVIGISALVSGNNEVNKSVEKTKNSTSKREKQNVPSEQNFAHIDLDNIIGNKNDQSFSFCGNCGTKFAANSSNNFCTECGNPRFGGE